MKPSEPKRFPVITPEACTGCEACIDVCPSETLSMQNGKAEVTGPKCMECGHCQAVCPAAAISAPAAEYAFSFSTFACLDTWLPYGQFDLSSLVRLMRSRRSCRNFLQKAVPQELLHDLIGIGITAPSGTNSQGWTFTLIPDREGVVELGKDIVQFFTRLNALAANPLYRYLDTLFKSGELSRYFQRHYPSVQKGLADWHKTGKDCLFHGAGALIIIGGKHTASCPCEDALLAAQNILLAAHAAGLGTCLIGYAVEALNHDEKLSRKIGIAEDEKVYAVIATGYPAERYQHAAGRKNPLIRVFKS